MNDLIIKEIDKCVSNCIYNKERMMFREFQYYKGKLIGMGYAARTLGLFDESNLCMSLLEEYPFKGKKPIDQNKIIQTN